MLKQFFSYTKPAPVHVPASVPMQPLKPNELVAVVGGPLIQNGGGADSVTTTDSGS